MMIGNLIGALVGKKVASHTAGMSETGGLVAGLAATTLLKRAGPVGLIMVLAGGYAIKHHLDRKNGGASRARRY
ncbi:MAG: hypothetical protein V4512_00340 [Pseudomonadota bacterium]|jgi:hypothetical protein